MGTRRMSGVATMCLGLVIVGLVIAGFQPAAAQPRRQAAHIHLDGISFNLARRHPHDATVASVAHFGHGGIGDVILRWGALHPDAIIDPPPMHGQSGEHADHGGTRSHPASSSPSPASECRTGDGLASECPGDPIVDIDRQFFAALAEIASLDPPRIDSETPRSEVGQEDVSPIFAAIAPQAVDMIDWTHGLHEVLYDILSSVEIVSAEVVSVEIVSAEIVAGRPGLEQTMRPPIGKLHHQPTFEVREGVAELFATALDDYYTRSPWAISPAPLETVVLERGRLEERPWFRYYRTNFVEAYGYFMLAHWWHPAIYETQMVFPEPGEQQAAVIEADRTLSRLIEERRFPKMMLLSREISPRFTSLSLGGSGERAVGAEAGNVFDNLHMLHGIVYDILSAPVDRIPALADDVEAYRARGLDLEAEAARPGRAGRRARHVVWKGRGREVAGMVELIGYRPGDEALAASYENHGPFNEDPRVFVEEWMRDNSGRGDDHCAAMMRSMGHCGAPAEADPHAHHAP